MQVTFERIRAALHVLADDSSPERLQRLIGFTRKLLDDDSARPAASSSWLGGGLVIEFRRRGHWSATLVIVADDNGAFVDVFTCELAFIAFDAIKHLLEKDPSVLGQAFVSVGDDVVSVSLPSEVELGAEEVAVLQSGCRPRALDDDDDDDDDATVPIRRWDMDATIVSAPPSDLLIALRRARAR